jgi:hypothetical protein
MGLLIDTSGSQMRVLDMEQEVGALFLQQVLAKQGPRLPHQLRRECRPHPRFHLNDASDLKMAMRKLKINAGFGGGGLPGPRRRPDSAE